MKVKKFYKFQPINKYSIAALIQKKSWYSNAESLNDPYDFRVGHLTPKHMLAFLSSKGAALPENLVEDFSLVAVERFKNLVHEELKDWGIFCLSARKDNLLMWSHYADAHRGMCLEFSIKDQTFRSALNKIRYQKTIPQVDLSKGIFNDREGILMLSTKSKDWSYEQEWRIINKYGNRLHPYTGSLTGVIFGHKTSQQDQETVERILKDEQMKFYDSKLHDSEFRVQITPRQIK